MLKEKNSQANKNGILEKFLGAGLLRVIAIPMGLITSIILARALGAQAYGQYSFLMTFATLLVVPIAGGLRPLLTREISSSKHSGAEDEFSAVIRASLFWVLSGSALFLLGVNVFQSGFSVLPETGKWAYLGTVMLLVPLMGLSAIRDGVLKGIKEPVWLVFLSLVLHPFVLLCLVISIYWFGFLSIDKALVSQIISMAIVLVLSLYLIWKKSRFVSSRNVDKYRLRKWAGMLFPFFVINIVTVLGTHVGILLLGFLGSDEAVAAFRVAERGAYLVGMSLVIINMVVPPYIVESWKGQKINELKLLLRKSAVNGFMISFPIAMIFIFWGNEVVTTVFGDEFDGIAYYPIVILSVGQLINVIFGAATVLLMMSGFERDIIKAQFPALIVNVGLCFFLIPSWGAVGAAIASAIAQLIMNVTIAIYVMIRIKMRPSFL
ncbi:MAG: flippase [Thalassolituus sp.]|jgi:O-antigen/teichoic acid export membrane protein